MYRDFILSREQKGGSTASQKATSIAAVGLFVLRVRVVTIVWVLNSFSFQNRRRRAGGGGVYNDNMTTDRACPYVRKIPNFKILY